MRTFEQEEQESCWRMEFFAYYIVILALIGATSAVYFLYHWVLG